MPDSYDAQNLQYVGGALIVLSLALLYCWWGKNNSNQYERLTPLRDQGTYGSFRTVEGMTAKQRASLPELSDNLANVKSMNDRENYSPNRHLPTSKQMRTNVTGMLWQTEAFTPGNSTEDPKSELMHSGYDDDADVNILMQRQQELVDDEVVTPLKPGEAIKLNSLSGDILQLTDYAPQYGPSMGRVTI